jgi:hypothetical protein
MTRRLPSATAAILAAALATTALAASAPKDPKTLVLQQSDVPAGARPGLSGPIPAGKKKAYTVTFNFRIGSREEELTSYAEVWKDAAGAKAGYTTAVAGYSGFGNEKVLQLPASGDEQHSDFNPTPARGQLIVRKNRVVWRLTIQSCGPLAPAGCLFGRTPPKMTQAQALSELAKYAPRQKARVGNG